MVIGVRDHLRWGGGGLFKILEYQNRILEHLKRVLRDLNIIKVHDYYKKLFLELLFILICARSLC